MAIAVTAGGVNTSLVSGATIAATVTAAVGTMVAVVVAADNSGTGGISPVTTCTDSAGNTYTKRGEITQNPGGTSNGATLAFFTAPVTSALVAGTVTVNFSPDTANKAISTWVVSGGTIGFRAEGAGSAAVTSTPSITATAVAAGDVIIGGLAGETNDAVTGDSDTTNGSWSADNPAIADGGGDTSSMNISTQAKIVTATGDQTYNPTGYTTTRDCAINWITLSVSQGQHRMFMVF